MNTEACEVDIEDDRKMRSTEKTERWWTLEKTNAQNNEAGDEGNCCRDGWAVELVGMFRVDVLDDF